MRSAPARLGAAPLVAGLVCLAGAAWFAWSLPATPGRRGRPSIFLVEGGPWRWLFDHAAPPGSPVPLAVTLVGVSLVMFAAWTAVIILTWNRSSRAAVRTVVALAALGAVISVFALPNKTSDIYDYVLFGRVAAAHDAEPYQDLPNAFPQDPTYRYSSHQYTGRPDNKLPVWTLAATGTAELAGDGPVTNLLAFRALLGGASVATTALVAWILGRIRPQAAASGAAAFGLSPLTLVYGTGKTDSLMVLLMVAAIALVVAGRTRVATVAGTLGVLVKLIAAPVLALVVLLPPLVGARRRPGAPRWTLAVGVAVRGLVALAVTALVYLVFQDPVGLARTHLIDSGNASAAATVGPATAVPFILLLAVMAWRSWRVDLASDVERARGLIAAAAPVLVVFAVLLTRPGLPWYLMTPLAVVALSRSVSLLVILGTVSVASFVIGWWDSVDTRAHPLPALYKLHNTSRPVLFLGLAVGATLVALAAHLATKRWRRPPAVSPPPDVGDHPPRPAPEDAAAGAARPEDSVPLSASAPRLPDTPRADPAAGSPGSPGSARSANFGRKGATYGQVRPELATVTPRPTAGETRGRRAWRRCPWSRHTNAGV